MVNRTQALVLGFFAGVLVSLILIRVMAPRTFDRALRMPADGRLKIAYVIVLAGFITLPAIGVFRRWRWTFWLMMVAFLAGALRVPVVILQVMGVLPADAPTWYLLVQGCVGVIQFGIGLVMVTGYRRAGVWGRC